MARRRWECKSFSKFRGHPDDNDHIVIDVKGPEDQVRAVAAAVGEKLLPRGCPECGDEIIEVTDAAT